jgi:glucose/arabinose dehydrogenase
MALGLSVVTVGLLAACTSPTDSPEGAATTGNEVTVEGTVGEPEVLTPVGLRLEQVTTLDRPVAFAVRPGSEDVYIAEQAGRVRRISGPSTPVTTTTTEPPEDGDDTGTNTTQTNPARVTPASFSQEQPPSNPDTSTGTARTGKYTLLNSPLLDISGDVRDDGERGLLGMAFSPDGRQLFLHYSDDEGDTVVARWDMTASSVDTSSRQTIFTTPQPFANHNGGQLAFGPDGYLYLGLGDGGGSGDPEGNGQNPDTPLGKVLRIDPDGATGDAEYAIPADNPFASGGGAPETWVLGLRNPWRFSFDRETGDLWLPDVGEKAREEITLLSRAEGLGRGANLGWPLYEGTEAFDTGAEPKDGLVAPLYEYNHDDGNCAVIGGFVYRGSAIEELVGTYLFGDWCTPEIQGLQVTDGAVSAVGGLGIDVKSLSSFGEDDSGELWVLSQEGGVYRILPA